jgi:zeaxanthin epoxidase
VFKVLDETPEDVIEQRDLYDRPPSLFKSWAKGNAVMIGDAVHPMMPNLGQGGCQAIEDAYVLAQRLAVVKDRKDIPSTLQVTASGCLVYPSLSRAGWKRYPLVS